MATISDVASLANVSVTTVSRVINDNPHVSAKKKKLVEDAMATLGYSPLQAARQMRGSGSRMIGVTVPYITNPFFSELVSAIETAAAERQYTAIIFQTGGRADHELVALDALKRNQVDAMILSATENDWSIIEPYEQFGIIGACNEYPVGTDVPLVRADQESGMYEGVSYLLKQGYRKVAFCTGQRNFTINPDGGDLNSDRYLGYLRALKENGLKVETDRIYSGLSTVEDGRNLMHQIIESDDAPDAIAAGSDQVAAGLVAEAQKVGFSIPDELAVLGFDDQPVSTVLSQPLTTIRQPIEKIGNTIANLVLDRLEGNTDGETKVTLPLSLVVRQSA